MNFDEMNRAFLIAAYSVMWIVVLGYLTRLIVKGSRVQREYDAMSRKDSGEDR
jgi:CcmD family protein